MPEPFAAAARSKGIPVVHVRERDTARDSKWLPWWNTLHPPPRAAGGEEGDGDGGHAGAGMVCSPEPWAAERGDEPVFVKHTYDCFLRHG